MILTTERARRWATHAARTGLAICGLLLAVGVVDVLGASTSAAAAPTPIPGLTLTPTSGDSATTFGITLVDGANACPGDTANDQYRVNSFMVPASVDPGTLVYNASGPIKPPNVAFTQPLYTSTNATMVNKASAPTTGVIINFGSLLSFSPLQYFDQTPAGAYKVGIACTLAKTTISYWWTQIDIVTDLTAGGPANFTWSVTGTSPTPADASTSASAASPTGVAAESSGAPAAAAGAAVQPSSAGATTAAPAVSSLAVVPATAAASQPAPAADGDIPVTGTRSTGTIVVLAMLMLMFGRMVVLLSRPIEVRS